MLLPALVNDCGLKLEVNQRPTFMSDSGAKSAQKQFRPQHFSSDHVFFCKHSCAPKVTTAYGVVEEPRTKKKNKLKVGETELGIKYIDLKVGDGPNPYDGDLIAINYIGFKMDGTEFDSQYSKKNLAFKYGAKQVIPGFEDVLATMRPGGQRSCTIPSKLAYGSKGVCIKDGCIVDPNEDLKFVITLRTVGAGYN